MPLFMMETSCSRSRRFVWRLYHYTPFVSVSNNVPTWPIRGWPLAPAGTDPEDPQVSPLWQCLNRFTREILIYDIILFTVAKFRFWLGLSSERFSGWSLVRSGFNTLYLGALWFGVCVFCLEGIINLCFIIIISWNIGGGGGGEKGPEHFLLFFFDEIILLLFWLLGIFCYFFCGVKGDRSNLVPKGWENHTLQFYLSQFSYPWVSKYLPSSPSRTTNTQCAGA